MKIISMPASGKTRGYTAWDPRFHAVAWPGLSVLRDHQLRVLRRAFSMRTAAPPTSGLLRRHPPCMRVGAVSNPPEHDAWSCDVEFLTRGSASGDQPSTWWVNRKDRGKSGSRRLPRARQHRVFDPRLAAAGGHLEHPDVTAWMRFLPTCSRSPSASPRTIQLRRPVFKFASTSVDRRGAEQGGDDGCGTRDGFY